MDKTLPLISAFGNPLWDVCISLPDNSVLSEFGLADDSSKEVTAAEYESLLQAVQGYTKEGCPGGAALNTLRVFQWLNRVPNSSVYLGGLGNDDIGKQLAYLVDQAGVSARFKVHEGLLTGSAICLIHGNFRTLVAHLGAADVYRPQDFTEEDKLIVSKVKLVYIENFFFSHSPDVVWEILRLCEAYGIAIVFNLSGSYLFEKHGKDIALLVKHVNVVIGNDSEYLALAKSCGWTSDDTKEIASKIANNGIQSVSSIPKQAIKLKNLLQWQKVVVITRGQKPIICASQGHPEFETQVLQPKFVKDTTGAGDAFVAGFLMGILKNCTLKECVQFGCYSAREIIQQIGCSPPNYTSLDIEEVKMEFV
ncbi:Adenosine kinase [Frankliniella fusca]|uniref:Adenosine kinase n=1 Tax=Frankliniella fusca TaxID=407009 RepID=A0AAE1HTF9_9NEOP|nr:Adenosine kinase [Frankliniella fusca]